MGEGVRHDTALHFFLDGIVTDRVGRAHGLLNVAFFEVFPGMVRPDAGEIIGLQLEAHGYQVSVTELVGWEHSMKNELIIASFKDLPRQRAATRLTEVLGSLGLDDMRPRFFTELTGAMHA